jgi:NADP-dependent 3-hydroxy acid dehydrogenase YdfG
MPHPVPVWFITSTSCSLSIKAAVDALRKGHHVIAACSPNDNSAALRAAGAFVLDFGAADPSELKKVTEKAISRYGRIDILINAAGAILEEAIEEATPEQMWDNFNMMIDMLSVTRTALGFMSQRRSGLIVNFGNGGSVAGGQFGAMKLAYSALAESLLSDIRVSGVRSTVVESRYCRSGIWETGANLSANELQGSADRPSDGLQDWEHVGMEMSQGYPRNR